MGTVKQGDRVRAPAGATLWTMDLEPLPEPHERTHARAVQAGTGLRVLLGSVSSLVGGVVLAAAVVGLATFATGWWVFDHSRPAWSAIGSVLCGAPVLASTAAWWMVAATARRADTLVDEIQRFSASDQSAAQTLIDHDTGHTISFRSQGFGSLPRQVAERRDEFPALHTAMRAVTTAPGLALRALVGIALVGMLGTVLLIGGLID